MVSAKQLFSLFTLLVLLIGLTPLQAQEKYPTRPIDLVIPYGPGGPSDIAGRVFAESLKTVLKVPITVVNKSGGGGVVGGVTVLNARKDGYTLLLGGGGWLVSSLTLKEVPYKDTLEDFIPISLICTAPHGFFVKEESPFKTIEDLIDKAKKSPKTISYAAASATDAHFNFEIFANASRLEFKFVPYKGTQEAITAVLGGHADIGISTVAAVTPFVQAKKARVLVINVPERIKELQDVPTLKEKGYTQTFIPNWQGIMVAAGVPKNIVDALISACDEALKSQELAANLAKVNFNIKRIGNAEFRKMVDDNRNAIKVVAKQIGH